MPIAPDAPPIPENGTSSQNVDNSNSEMNQQRKYTGLSNQGATCYLNSLIQSLYMTPKIRNKLYQWRYDPQTHGSAERSIPYQLQTLFARLQLSQRKAIETEDLTKSFGWDLRDSFVQHDINELCRVLFEALDKTFAPNLYRMRNELTKAKIDSEIEQIKSRYEPHLESDHLMSDMYSGSMIDYIHAKDRFDENGKPIGNERKDKFLDIQLVVHDIHSVEDSLRNYIKPEVMEGDCQWSCDQIGEKVDALKGFKFEKFPEILTLHLKRFDYDRRTWTPVKLGHRITFPFELDISEFVPETYPEDERIYELFSVMIHSGSVRAGHYYAYIKDITRDKDAPHVAHDKWYEFNDSNVRPIDKKKVEDMYGKDEDAHSYTSTNAYMLMYRLRKANRNVDDLIIDTDAVPIELKDQIVKENEEHEKRVKEEEIRRNTVRFKFYYYPNNDPSQDRSYVSELSMHNSHTIRELKEQVIECFKEKIPDIFQHDPDCVRICEFDMWKKTFTKSFDQNENDKISKYFKMYETLALEHKSSPEEPWKKPSRQIDIHLYMLNPDNDSFETPRMMELNSALTLKELKANFSQRIRNGLYPPEHVNIIRKTHPFKIVEFKRPGDEDRTLDELIGDYDYIYVEILQSPDAPSRVKEKLELDEYYYILYFNYPESNEYDQQIAIKKICSLDNLKSEISKRIDISLDQFRMCTLNKDPYERTHRKLREVPGIYNDTKIHIEKGASLKPGEFLVHVYKYMTETTYFKKKDIKKLKEKARRRQQQAKQLAAEENKDEEAEESSIDSSQQPDAAAPMQKRKSVQSDDDSSESSRDSDVDTYTRSRILSSFKRKVLFSKVGQFLVSNIMLLKEFRSTIAEEMGYSPDQIRIRLKDDNRARQILYLDDSPMKINYPQLASRKDFCVQVLPKTEQFSEEDSPFIFELREWKSDEWLFSSSTEVIIDSKKHISSKQLKEYLAPILDIPAEYLGLHKAPYSFDHWPRKECNDIALLDWKFETENVYQKPMDLNQGDLMFYRDLRKGEKYNLKDLEEKNCGSSIYSHSYRSVYSFTPSYSSYNSGSSRERETQLKIRTEFDDPDPKIEQNSNEKSTSNERSLVLVPNDEDSSSDEK